MLLTAVRFHVDPALCCQTATLSTGQREQNPRICQQRLCAQHCIFYFPSSSSTPESVSSSICLQISPTLSQRLTPPPDSTLSCTANGLLPVRACVVSSTGYDLSVHDLQCNHKFPVICPKMPCSLKYLHAINWCLCTISAW